MEKLAGCLDVVRFSGEVEDVGDSCRVFESNGCDLRIDGVDFLSELLNHVHPRDSVRISIDGKVVSEGEFFGDLGFGYSEYTPLESDCFGTEIRGPRGAVKESTNVMGMLPRGGNVELVVEVLSRYQPPEKKPKRKAKP